VRSATCPAATRGSDCSALGEVLFKTHACAVTIFTRRVSSEYIVSRFNCASESVVLRVLLLRFWLCKSIPRIAGQLDAFLCSLCRNLLKADQKSDVGNLVFARKFDKHSSGPFNLQL
jgi:hypothetical protein